MSEVTIIGLGDMGSALARTLLGSGHRVTVWNRTAAKAEPLANLGATVAGSVEEAVTASPFVIVCVSNYETTKDLLGGLDLEGRLMLELTTGTPQDARGGKAWVRERGGEYLDGAIMATPRQIGTAEAPILVSGPPTAFERVEPLVRALGGQSRYVGEEVGLAAAWDLAILSFAFGGMIGFYHGVRICEVEGIPVEAFGETIAAMAPVVGEFVRYEGEIIAKEKYDEPESTLQTCLFAFQLMRKHAREAGIGAEFPVFAEALFQRGVDAGYGAEQAGALIKVLRKGA